MQWIAELNDDIQDTTISVKDLNNHFSPKNKVKLLSKSMI